jgi:Protein of unknown function (DUF2924)
MTHRLPKSGPEKLAADLKGLALRTDRELRDSWRSLYGTEPPKKIHRSLLIQGVGYRMQENGLGGLKSSTRRQLMRAAENVAGGRDIGVSSNRSAKPGTVLVREWGSVIHQVTVQEHGMLFRGKRYGSLSEIARVITGSRWVGTTVLRPEGRGQGANPCSTISSPSTLRGLYT